MISILIPTYSYDVFQLAETIEKQALKANIVFELICIDDASFSPLNIKNQNINTLTNCKFIELKKNIGRTSNRQLLAERAQYNWLLFLDADTLPSSDDFLEKHIEAIKLDKDVIFGGITYEDNPPNEENILRWKYGKEKEEVLAKIRSKNPYKHVVSANMLIKKEVFLIINSTINFKGYGLDNYFGLQLKQNNCSVHHLDNEVIHLGIEKSTKYLNKKETAADTLLKLVKEKKVNKHSNSLLRLFLTLKNFGLTGIPAFIYKKFNNSLKSNLTGSNPSIKLLQLYRICYLCYRYNNN